MKDEGEMFKIPVGYLEVKAQLDHTRAMPKESRPRAAQIMYLIC